MTDAATLGLGHLAAFNLALLFAVAAPGPAFLLYTQAALRGGRAEGIAVGAGLAVVAGLWTLAALAGLETLFALFPALYLTFKLAGAAMVLGFAWLAWTTADAPVAATPRVSGRRAFARGAALNLGNPKSIVFSAGVLLVIFPPDLSLAQMALVTVNQIALELAVYATLATLLTRPAVRARYLSFKPLVQRAMAVVLGALGLRLLVGP